MNIKKISKKNIIKIALLLILIVFLSIAFINQFMSPVVPENAYITIEPFTEQDLSVRKNYYNMYINQIGDGNQFIRKDNPFPSENYEDYSHVLINIEFKNKSLFSAIITDAFITNTEHAKNVIYKRPIVINTNINRLEKGISNDSYHLFLWNNGMNEDEIQNYIKNIELEVYYETDISNSKKIRISLDKAVLVNQDDLIKIKSKFE